MAGPTGYPERTSAAEPGSTHCRLYRAPSQGLPTLSDKGYAGGGIAVLSPVKGKNLDSGTACFNQLLNLLRALADRANALFKQTWRALQHITLDPARIGDITAESSP